MNGAEHKAMVPHHIQELCEKLNHFGDAWPKTVFQNLEGNEITMLTPPERLPLEKPKFFSKVTLLTQRGPVDLGFEILGAVTLADAEHLWRASAQGAIIEMHNQMQANQRRVVLPGEAGAAPFKKLALNS